MSSHFTGYCHDWMNLGDYQGQLIRAWLKSNTILVDNQSSVVYSQFLRKRRLLVYIWQPLKSVTYINICENGIEVNFVCLSMHYFLRDKKSLILRTSLINLCVFRTSISVIKSGLLNFVEVELARVIANVLDFNKWNKLRHDFGRVDIESERHRCIP